MSVAKCPSVIGHALSGSMQSIRVIGVSFRTAELGDREKLAKALREVASRTIHAVTDDTEIAFLVTCNRIEAYGLANEPRDAFTQAARLAGIGDRVGTLCYSFAGDEAVRHLFRMVCGLDSAVLGENEIVSQVKDAWEAGSEQGNIGPVLRTLLDRALIANKSVRRHTKIGQGKTSVASVGISAAVSQCGGIKGRHVAIVGAGQMAELCLKYVSGLQASQVTILNRSMDRATRIAKAFEAEARPLDALAETLAETDLAIFAVTSPNFLVNKDTLPTDGRLRTLLDLSLPRVVDPAVSESEGVILLDLESIKSACEENSEHRSYAAMQAEAIVEEQVAETIAYFQARHSNDTIAELMHRAEEIRQFSLTKATHKLASLNETERQAVEELTRRIVLGLLEGPIADLRASGGCHLKRQVVKRIFGLIEDKAS